MDFYSFMERSRTTQIMISKSKIQLNCFARYFLRPMIECDGNTFSDVALSPLFCPFSCPSKPNQDPSYTKNKITEIRIMQLLLLISLGSHSTYNMNSNYFVIPSFTIQNDKSRNNSSPVVYLVRRGQNPEWANYIWSAVILFQVRRLVAEGLRFTLSCFT